MDELGGIDMQEALAVSIPEAARRLGVSARTVATLVARNELRSLRIGRRRVIPTRVLEEFLNRDHTAKINKADQEKAVKPHLEV
jgi:excisionase family DNA binding protein